MNFCIFNSFKPIVVVGPTFEHKFRSSERSQFIVSFCSIYLDLKGKAKLKGIRRPVTSMYGGQY